MTRARDGTQLQGKIFNPSWNNSMQIFPATLAVRSINWTSSVLLFLKLKIPVVSRHRWHHCPSSEILLFWFFRKNFNDFPSQVSHLTSREADSTSFCFKIQIKSHHVSLEVFFSLRTHVRLLVYWWPTFKKRRKKASE